VAWRCEASGIQGPGNHRLCLQPAPLQPANGTPRFVSASGIEGSPDIERGLGMGAAMPAHEQIKSMRTPAPACGPKALSIERRCKIREGGEACRAQLIKQESQLLERRREARSSPHVG